MKIYYWKKCSLNGKCSSSQDTMTFKCAFEYTLQLMTKKRKKEIREFNFFFFLQDGKVPPPPGFSVPRPSSSSNGNNFHQRSYESKMSPHGQPPHPGLIKSSPLSDESPSSDRLSQSKLLFMKSGFVFKTTMILTQ